MGHAMHGRRSIGNGISRIWSPMYISQALYPFMIISYAPKGLSATLNSVRWILVMNTSRKPCIKFAGNLASGFSSSRKNFMTCGICFQKFNVSCHHAVISMHIKVLTRKHQLTPLHLFIGDFGLHVPCHVRPQRDILAYLVLCMATKKQHIHHG